MILLFKDQTYLAITSTKWINKEEADIISLNDLQKSKEFHGKSVESAGICFYDSSYYLVVEFTKTLEIHKWCGNCIVKTIWRIIPD